MAGGNQTAAIIGGAIVLAAAVAGGTYVMMKRPAATTVEAPAPAPEAPAPTPAPVPAPVAATPPPTPAPTPPANSEAGTAVLPDIATVEFAPALAQYSVIRSTAVYVAPSTDAPKMYTLPPGLGVRTTSQSKDGKWVIPVTANGQAAYLLTADLGPYQPGAMQTMPLQAQTVVGPATVVDTGTLKVNDQRVPLFGLAGETGVLADNLQDLITSNGGIVTCQPQAQAFICTLANGTDVGRAALYNGAATPNADATPDYQAQTNAAKQAHRGLWR